MGKIKRTIGLLMIYVGIFYAFLPHLPADALFGISYFSHVGANLDFGYSHMHHIIFGLVLLLIGSLLVWTE